MILVTGATGTVGTHLLRLLVEHGASLRAVAHSRAGRAKIEGLGLEAVDGDFDQPGSLERAMEGCDRLFLLSPTAPNLAAREVAAIDAARRAGVSHVVALSTMGADRQSPCSLLSRHAEVEDHLVGSGLDYTVLRAACFMQVHLLPVQTVKAQGAWYSMTGGGAHAYIDAHDIAAAAAVVLTTPGHQGKVYELTGPRAITISDAATELSEVIGSSVTYVDRSAGEFEANLLATGIPEWLVEGIVALYQIIREGHIATTTGFVEQLTGRPPRAYREFAEAHKEAFAGS